jgi:hypothetical protein
MGSDLSQGTTLVTRCGHGGPTSSITSSMRASTTRGLALPSDLAVLRLTLSRILIGGCKLSPLLGSLTLCNVSNFAQTPSAVGPMLTDGEGNFLADAEFAVLLVFRRRQETVSAPCR